MNAPTRGQEVAAPATGVELPPFQMAPYVGGQDLVLHGDYFDKVDRLANIMSKAKGAVPKHLIGNPGACFSVALTAIRANFDPFGVARKTWMGPDETIKYESQLVIALINNSGLLVERLKWEYFGDWAKILGRFERRQTKKKDRDGNLVTDGNGDVKTYMAKLWSDAEEKGLGVRCIGRLKGESEPRVTELLMAQAITRNSTLWVEDPRQQIAYLSGYRWGRIHTPEAIMGIYTPDEEFEPPRDMGPVDVVTPQIDPALLKAAEDAAARGRTSYTDFWKNCTHLQRAILSEQSDHHERLKKVAADADDKRTVNTTPKATSAPTSAPAAAPVSGQHQAGASATPDTTDAPFKATQARVFEMMKKAADEKNSIAMDIAADWIPEVEDAGERDYLTKQYEAFKAELTGGTKQ